MYSGLGYSSSDVSKYFNFKSTFLQLCEGILKQQYDSFSYEIKTFVAVLR